VEIRRKGEKKKNLKRKRELQNLFKKLLSFSLREILSRKNETLNWNPKIYFFKVILTSFETFASRCLLKKSTCAGKI
jgi:hypothetical protein